MTRTQAIVFDMDGVLIDSEELHAQAKRIPSPEVYLLTAARLALPPSECMVVEDALTGVLSAKRAGCCVSALTRSFPARELVEAGANFTFEDFVSLKRFSSLGT
jgi:beta-phosphoglucomutase-like phosphatase (HAD superfamily)